MSHHALSWLHLSDMHVDVHVADSGDENGSGAESEQERCWRALERDLDDRENWYSGAGIPPLDFMILSGDIVKRGASVEAFERAHTYIQRMCDRTGVPPARVFLVPGNHDLNRDRLPDTHPTLLDFSNTSTADFRSSVDDLWGAASERAQIDAKFDNYRSFASRYAPVTLADIYSWYYLVEINGLHVHLIGLNSVWTGGSDELDKPGMPVIGDDQRELIDAQRLGKAEPDLTLVLQHNPTSYLNSTDSQRHAKWLDELDPVVYCGHIHLSETAERRSVSGRHLELMGGALYAGYAEKRRYSVGTLTLERETRSFSLALRAADTSSGFFTADTHLYPGARNGFVEFGQNRDRPNLGEAIRRRDELEVELERASLKYDAGSSKYFVWVEKTYRNPTQRVWTHIPARILVNAFPNDPLRSRALYREHPLELEDIEFGARWNGRRVEYSVQHDHDSSKDVLLVLEDPASGKRGLEPEESGLIEYSFAIGRELWGPYFERHIRNATDEIRCELDFPVGCLQGDPSLRLNPRITNTDVSQQIRAQAEGDRTRYFWEQTYPHHQSRYCFDWSFLDEG